MMVRVVVTEMVKVPPGPPVCTETMVSVTVAVPGLCVGFGFLGGGCFGGCFGGVGFNGLGSGSIGPRLGVGRQRLSRQRPP